MRSGHDTSVHQFKDGAGWEGLDECLHVQQRCRCQMTDSCCIWGGAGVVLFVWLLCACCILFVFVDVVMWCLACFQLCIKKHNLQYGASPGLTGLPNYLPGLVNVF